MRPDIIFMEKVDPLQRISIPVHNEQIRSIITADIKCSVFPEIASICAAGEFIIAPDNRPAAKVKSFHRPAFHQIVSPVESADIIHAIQFSPGIRLCNVLPDHIPLCGNTGNLSAFTGRILYSFKIYCDFSCLRSLYRIFRSGRHDRHPGKRCADTRCENRRRHHRQ